MPRCQMARNFKRDFEYNEEQEEVETTPEKIKKILRKMPRCSRFLVVKF